MIHGQDGVLPYWSLAVGQEASSSSWGWGSSPPTTDDRDCNCANSPFQQPTIPSFSFPSHSRSETGHALDHRTGPLGALQVATRSLSPRCPAAPDFFLLHPTATCAAGDVDASLAPHSTTTGAVHVLACSILCRSSLCVRVSSSSSILFASAARYLLLHDIIARAKRRSGKRGTRTRRARLWRAS
ncbi:hypothetical protein BD289DRAFT_136037 [Coniella lustricola]|uniref:Uncharacterized protein n=1 Tax=Coniella lustricola TaxID=2025994 RepID=A0A2T3AFF1_9PEZI|nr:hypothetical protein BD289DRAFT_136037 [Coniella lustricola]